MNKKNIFAALALACCLPFAACSQAQPTSFTANWRKNTVDALDTVNLSGMETAVYNVSFESGDNTAYSVDYPDGGTYTTRLSSQDGNYLYETELKIGVRFSCAGETSETFNDFVLSSVIFESTQKGLRPIRSVKTSASHVPASASPASLNGKDACYAAYFTRVTTDYSNFTCTTEYFTDETFKVAHESVQTQTRSFEADDKYSLIDNEELLLAVRGIEGTSAKTVYVYNTSAGKLQKVQISQSSKESTDFDFTIVGRESEGTTQKAVSYVPFTLSINDANPGSSQKLWVAKTTDVLNNAYRNVILRMETPVSFNLGTLIYQLQSVEFLNE